MCFAFLHTETNILDLFLDDVCLFWPQVQRWVIPIPGRTLPLYTCLRVLISAPQVVPARFFMILNLRSAFFSVFSL